MRTCAGTRTVIGRKSMTRLASQPDDLSLENPALYSVSHSEDGGFHMVLDLRTRS